MEREILRLLSSRRKPLATQEIVDALGRRLRPRFSRADMERTTDNTPRWEKTARFAMYQGLVRKDFVKARVKNRWVLTPRGRAELMRPAA